VVVPQYHCSEADGPPESPTASRRISRAAGYLLGLLPLSPRPAFRLTGCLTDCLLIGGDALISIECIITDRLTRTYLILLVVEGIFVRGSVSSVKNLLVSVS